MADPFKQKEKSIERAETITGLAREVLNKKKKPVKFTWKGFANLASGFLETNPFDKLKTDRIKELQEGSEAKEKDYIDFFEDIEKSLYGGVQDLGYAVGDLLTSGVDAVAGTDLSEKLDEVYEENKIKDPETLTGSITKVLTQYAVPGGAAFKILNRVKILQRNRKLAETGTKLQKGSQIAKRAGYMASALAATDFVASTPDKETLFVKEEKTEGLTGRDLALAKLRNRVRFGTEGALFTGILSGTGKVIKKITFLTKNINLTKLNNLFINFKIDYKKIKKILFCSVVPKSLKIIKIFLSKKTRVKFYEVKNLNLKSIMKIKANYKQVGSDRLTNAISLLNNKTNFIILDFGTATTFDVLIKNTYKGGVIAPGVKLSLNTLSDKATLIPKINLKKIKNVIGNNTISAVRAGFFWGYSGLIDNIINLIKKETGKSFKVIITGGFSNLFKNSIKTKVKHNKDITINGLIKISELIK